jgi:hypothetical protein
MMMMILTRMKKVTSLLTLAMGMLMELRILPKQKRHWLKNSCMRIGPRVEHLPILSWINCKRRKMVLQLS